MEADERFPWLEARVEVGLHATPKELKSLLSHEESRRHFVTFFNTPDARRVFVYSNNGANELVASNQPPQQTAQQVGEQNQQDGLPQRIMAFFKPNRVAVREDTIDEEVVYVECSALPLDHLFLIGHDVFLPLLSTTVNQNGWESEAPRILDFYQRFLGSVYVTIGHTQGKTLLHLPPADVMALTRSDRPAFLRDKEKVHVLESSVVTWTRQIKNILKTDPEAALKAGLHPGAIMECHFWAAKAANLNSIHTQLEVGKVSKVVRILDLTKSTYATAFHRISKEVMQARIEANEVVRFLEPLKPYFERLHSTRDFLSLVDVFWPMMHTLLRVWESSAYYHQNAHLVMLLKQICNDVIMQARQYLESSTLFRADPASSYAKLRNVLKVCAALRGSYHDYKLKADTAYQKSLNVGGDHHEGASDAAADSGGDGLHNGSDGTPDADGTMTVTAAEKRPEPAATATNREAGGVTSGELPAAWPARNASAFHRLDMFLERCHDILDLTQTAINFSNLEKVEIGGKGGKTLTTAVRHIHAEFAAAVMAFKEVPYDALDIGSSSQFDDDYYQFRCLVKDLERRLGIILSQSFDSCTTLASSFKLLEAFEGLAHREIIQASLESRCAKMLGEYKEDLKCVNEQLKKHSDAPPVSANMPPMAGSLLWVRELKGRVEEPMAKFRAMPRARLETDEGRDAIHRYNTVVAQLDKYERDRVASWLSDMESVSQIKLKQPLLTRNPPDAEHRFIHVNFDAELICMMREVAYMERAGVTVPSSAAAIHRNAEVYRSQAESLEIITSKYNSMLSQIQPIELPLFQHKVEEVDALLELGLAQLNWKSYGINDFINDATVLIVKDVHATLTEVKNNCAAINNIVAGWTAAAGGVFAQRDPKVTYDVAALKERHRKVFNSFVHDLIESGKEIHSHVALSSRKLKISKGAPAWKAYVKHINDIVVEGLVRAVKESLHWLLMQLDPDSMAAGGAVPLVEVHLELVAPDVLFSPPLDESGGYDSIKELVEEWVRDFISIGKYVKRLDMDEGDLTPFVEASEEVSSLVLHVGDIVNVNEKECIEMRDSYIRNCSHLWLTDVQSSFEKFLESGGGKKDAAHFGNAGKARTHKVIKLKHGAETSVWSWMSNGPSLEEFDSTISVYRVQQEKIQQLPMSANAGWLRINLRPVNQAVGTWVTKWIFSFTRHLMVQAVQALDDLSEFLERVEAGLEIEVTEATDVGTCLSVMYVVHEIRAKQDATNRMFEPLRRTITLLKKYGQSLPDSVSQFFAEAPGRWNALKKRVSVAREQLAPHMQSEAVRIVQRISEFQKEIAVFRVEFLQCAPFQRGLEEDEADKLIAEWEKRLSTVEATANDLLELEELLETSQSDFVEMNECRADLNGLTAVWALSRRMHTNFKEWMSVPWNKCDTVPLLASTSSELEAIDALAPRAAEWDVVQGLRDYVISLRDSVPLVEVLRSRALRERHWKQLMRVTHTSFHVEEDSTLGELMAMELDRHVDAVRSIVERATKELEIELSLKRIDCIWVSRVLEFQPYRRGGVNVGAPANNPAEGAVSSPSSMDARSPAPGNNPGLSGNAGGPSSATTSREECAWVLCNCEPIFEMLERMQIMLQSLHSSRYVTSFKDEVVKWEQRLHTVEGTLLAWLNVQQAWANIEEIFQGTSETSVELRKTLAQDSLLFKTTDKEWRELMQSSRAKPNVVQACSREGFLSVLQKMESNLQHCEKSLTKFLSHKCTVFPRFFFVSTHDLVHILCRGPYPIKVSPYMPKLVSSIHHLEIEEKEGGAFLASGLWSNDGEHMEFSELFPCTGPVEGWLSGLLGMVESSLRDTVADALATIPKPGGEDTGSASWLEWINQHLGQINMLAMQVDVTRCIQAALSGEGGGLEDCSRRRDALLSVLCTLISTELPQAVRRKLDSLLVYALHTRDLVNALSEEKATSSCFRWQAQMRFTWDASSRTVAADIGYARFNYGFEYLGCDQSSIVMTPLTERCFVTAAHALHSFRAAAFLGPAAVGKTETIKVLGHMLGMPVYAFNCSAQMDLLLLGNVLKGMASTGAWVCLDSLTRVSTEVLSVLSMTMSSLHNALRAGRSNVVIDGTETALVPTCACFMTHVIDDTHTASGGLPANLAQHFRPIAMVAPDLEIIAEAKLLVHGFQNPRRLARHVLSLYARASELLAPQTHYNWGIRAILSLIDELARLKASHPDASEHQMVYQAFMDCSACMVDTKAQGVLRSVVQNMFPTEAMDAETLQLPTYDAVRKALLEVAPEMEVVPTPVFVDKVLQLNHLLTVTHAVMLVGPVGCGKTQIIRSLAAARDHIGAKVTAFTLDPKSVSPEQLFGFFDPQTHDWRDGLLSSVIRKCSSLDDGQATEEQRWVVLDGDVDPLWTERMHSVLDTNKVLTLPNNERISITPSMRFVFEVDTLVYSSPATVSRVGIMTLSENDVGWQPLIERWLHRHTEKAANHDALKKLCEKYVAPTLQFLRSGKVSFVLPNVCDINMVETMCTFVDALLGQAGEAIDGDLEAYEHYFNYAAMWAFGGPLATESWPAFSEWWIGAWSDDVAFPVRSGHRHGEVRHYFVHPDIHRMVHWADHMPSANSAENLGPGSFVPTVITESMMLLLNLLVSQAKPVMFVGDSGTGKRAIMKEKIRQITTHDDAIALSVSANSLTTSLDLQTLLNSSLERKIGRTYAPPGQKKLVCLIDNLSMAAADECGAQSVCSHLRTHIDRGGYYDHNTLQWRKVQNVLYFTTVDPSVLTNWRDLPRLQRHFALFACPYPSQEDMHTIYSHMLTSHLSRLSADQLPSALLEVCSLVVRATVELQSRVRERFMPTPAKSHYHFNLRELTVVFLGLCASEDRFKSSRVEAVRLWAHECERVYCDRLVNTPDIREFREILMHATKKYFEETDQLLIDAQGAQLYVPFRVDEIDEGAGDLIGSEPVGNALVASPSAVPGMTSNHVARGPCKQELATYSALRAYMKKALTRYNETHPRIMLVLFDEVLRHVARIARILNFAHLGGNALLAGSGGSGKQTLARLAAYICRFEVFQIASTSRYNLADFKSDLVSLYFKAGVKGHRIVFLLTESQIMQEEFLVLINDFLSTGSIPNLFTTEEKNNIMNSIQSEVKQAGLLYKPDVAWKYFIDKVRTHMRIIICLATHTDSFRRRCRQFPALVKNTTIVWFQPWNKDTLVSVAVEQLKDVDLDGEEMKENLAHHMAFVHTSVEDVVKQLGPRERRDTFTLPSQKCFFELIKRFSVLMRSKRVDLDSQHERLALALSRIDTTTAEANKLREVLKNERVVLEEKAVGTNKLLAQIGQDMTILEEQTAVARAEEEHLEELSAKVKQYELDVQVAVDAAHPAEEAALKSVERLTKANVAELRSSFKPSSSIVDVLAAVLLLLGPSKGNADTSWPQAKKTMANVDKFLDSLHNFDRNSIPEATVASVEPFLEQESFQGSLVESTSVAAAALCDWVRNIVNYHHLQQRVFPLKEALDRVQASLDAERVRLDATRVKIQELESRIRSLTDSFEAASGDKSRQVQQTTKTEQRLQRAECFISALDVEAVRWKEMLSSADELSSTLVGDVVVAAAFVTYMGGFSLTTRNAILSKHWIPDLKERGIPSRLVDGAVDGPNEDITPHLVRLLTDSSQLAKWATMGLPTNLMSVQNGAIVEACYRWPLLIDPHHQGVRWVKCLEGRDLLVARIGQKDPPYLSVLERAISTGAALLIENVGETIDQTLLSVITQASVARQDTSTLHSIHMLNKEVEYHPDFRFYLATSMSSPEYSPAISAATTLINYKVNEEGFVDLLLEDIVGQERAALVSKREEVVVQQNEEHIRLRELEDQLLGHLCKDTNDIFSKTEVIEECVRGKREIEARVVASDNLDLQLTAVWDAYRPLAMRGAMLFFLMDSLSMLQPCYRYSLTWFLKVCRNTLNMCPEASTSAASTGGVNIEPPAVSRISQLVTILTECVSDSLKRGLFEEDQLLVAAQMAFNVCRERKAMAPTPRGTAPGTPSLRELGSPSLTPGAAPGTPTLKAVANTLQPDNLVHRRLTRPVLAVKQEVIPDDIFQYFLRGRSGHQSGLSHPLLLAPEMGSVLTSVRERAGVSGAAGAHTRNPHAEWLPDEAWAAVGQMAMGIKKFGSQVLTALMETPEKWKSWYSHDQAETQQPPMRPTSPFEVLLIIRCFRPDRIGAALSDFVNRYLGANFVNNDSYDLGKVVSEVAAYSPMLLPLRGKTAIISGTRHIDEVLALAEKEGRTVENNRLFHVALGVHTAAADAALAQAAQGGGWVVLENVHLHGEWLAELLKQLQVCEMTLNDDPEGGSGSGVGGSNAVSSGLTAVHPDFRLFVTADIDGHALPVTLFRSTTVLTRSSSTTLAAAFKGTFEVFRDPAVQAASQAYKTALFSLCVAHAVLCERRQYGALGWSHSYHFSSADLMHAKELLDRMTNGGGGQVVWSDLQALLSDTVYGAHFTDPWDRRLCRTTIEQLVTQSPTAGGPGLAVPSAFTYDALCTHVDALMEGQPESQVFGLPTNAQLKVQTRRGRELLRSLSALQPASSEEPATLRGLTHQEIIKNLIDYTSDMLEGFSPLPNGDGELGATSSPGNIGTRGVFRDVLLQECMRMNRLLSTLRSSLSEIDNCLCGDAIMTPNLIELRDSLLAHEVPNMWEKVAFRSQRSLVSWLRDLARRVKQLSDWVAAGTLPHCTWLPGLFSPQSFLVAVQQREAERLGCLLGEVEMDVEVTKLEAGEVHAPAPNGVYVHGLSLEGASWDRNRGELVATQGIQHFHVALPVLHLKASRRAVDADAVTGTTGSAPSAPSAATQKGFYECPVYATRARAKPVFSIRLPAGSNASRWIMAGTALLLDSNDDSVCK